MIFANLLADKMQQADIAKGKKPTAMGTLFRYSAAGSCARQQAYTALGEETTESWDVCSAYVTGLGETIHVLLQKAISEKYPNAQFEIASKVNDYISGSCDGFLTMPNGDKVVIEIKTRGQFAWQKETGYGMWKQVEPEGPKWAAITQAGMNAMALGAEHVVMISLAKECISVSKAEKMGIADPHERYAAEWWVPREEWETYALEEIDRINSIVTTLDSGFLPEPEVVDDNGKRVKIKHLSHWSCDYCDFKTLCKSDGPGLVPVTITTKKEEK
jgi:hypothetical protein